jgi:hypothetical protein
MYLAVVARHIRRQQQQARHSMLLYPCSYHHDSQKHHHDAIWSLVHISALTLLQYFYKCSCCIKLYSNRLTVKMYDSDVSCYCSGLIFYNKSLKCSIATIVGCKIDEAVCRQSTKAMLSLLDFFHMHSLHKCYRRLLLTYLQQLQRIETTHQVSFIRRY